MSIRRRIKAVEERDRKEVLAECVIPLEDAYAKLIENIRDYQMFFGAGVSVSAGVPLAEDIVDSIVVRVFEKSNPARRGQVSADELKEWVARQKWYNPAYKYVSALEKEYPSVFLRTELFKGLLKGKQPSPTHLMYVIGVKAGKLNPVLYTTNWDTLTEDAYYILRGTSCMTVRSIDELKLVNLEDGRYVVKIHGDYDKYDVRYIREGMAKHHDDLKAFMRQSLSNVGLFVVGYSGNEYSVMNTLIELANDYPDVLNKGLVWAYKGNIKQVPEPISDLLAVGLEKGKHFVLCEIDESDYLFEQIAADLELPSIEDELSFSFQRFNVVPYGDIRRREGPIIPELKDLVHRDILDEGFLVANYEVILEQWEKETKGLFKKKEEKERAARDAERKLVNHTYNDLKGGSYEDSERKFKDILTKFPDNPAAHFGLAWGYYVQERYDEARQALQKAISLKSDDHGYYILLGMIARQEQKWQDEAAAYEKALELKPDLGFLWYNIGLSYYHLDNLEKEHEAYEKCLETTGSNAGAWYNLGMVLYKVGRKLQAQRCFFNAREINPRFFKAWYNSGILLGKLGQDYRAMAYFDKAIELNEDDDYAFKNRGVAEVMIRDWERAKETYEYFLEVEPQDTESWSNFALALHGLGEHDQALEYINRYLEKVPEDPRVWYNKGLILWAKEQRPEALECFDKSISINPNFDLVWYRKALLLGEIGDHDGKAEWLTKYLSENPEDSKAWYQLGLADDELESWRESVDAYDHALRTDPTNIEYLMRKATAQNLMGDAQGAEDTCERVLRLTTQEPEIWYQKALAEVELGEQLKAINSFDQCIKQNPKHKKAYLNKGVILAQLEQFAKAVEHFDQAIALDKDYLPAYENRAYSLIQLKEYERAGKAYEEGLARFPDNGQLLMGYANLHVLMRENQKALELLGKAVGNDPELAEVIAQAPEFDRLRQDPDFRSLVGKAG
ncbi:tetratricopeptide repeat protein [bacterium]|nr:tetratricopeptide repeat protein [bacterium]